MGGYSDSGINEAIISKYRVYLAKNGQRTGNSLGDVTKSSTSSNCCVTDKYHLDVTDVEFPDVNANYSFMVVVVDSNSVELKFGTMSPTIVRRLDEAGVASNAQRQIVNPTSVTFIVGASLVYVLCLITPF